MKRVIALIGLLIFACVVVNEHTRAQKVTAEQILEKHIASIGNAVDRKNMFNITAVGEVGFQKSTSTREPGMGKVVFAAEANKMLFAMTFPSSTYQGEQIKFDGSNLRVEFSQPGVRSILGDYIFRYDTIAKHSLLGGALSEGWAMYDLASHNTKVTYDGTKKINGVDTYVINYEPKKGSDVRIKLYFEQATYRHIRTEYRRTNGPGMGNNPNTSSQLVETHEDMTEEFSDFKTEYGVTLPRTYKIHIFVERNRASYEQFYTCKFTEIFYNSKLDPATFDTGSGTKP